MTDEDVPTIPLDEIEQSLFTEQTGERAVDGDGTDSHIRRQGTRDQHSDSVAVMGTHHASPQHADSSDQVQRPSSKMNTREESLDEAVLANGAKVTKNMWITGESLYYLTGIYADIDQEHGQPGMFGHGGICAHQANAHVAVSTAGGPHF